MTLSEMAALVAIGDAERLFADDPVGPHRYADAWWVIPESKSRFERVEAPELAARLTHEAARLRAAGVPTVRSLR